MIPWIPNDDIDTPFPGVESALAEPDGLLAAGGNLSPPRLLLAYQNGIFPWFSDHEPILWWSPSTRCVIFANNIHISKSMSRLLKKGEFSLTHNKAFEQVIHACAQPRPGQPGTWITEEMINAYCRMHELAYAHSYECWHENRLVGGIYGIQLGQVFFGESMFSSRSNASKAVLIHTARQDHIQMIDCQNYSSHLESMGAAVISRKKFIELLKQYKVR